MPLDPAIAGVLSLLASLERPTLSSGTPEAARAAFRFSTVGLRQPATLAPVRAVEDTTVPGADGPLRARIYRPEGDGPVPALVFFHGGGFVIGDIDTHDDQARLLCRDAGVVVLSVDYRLAPEHPFPAGYDDCLAATRWAGDNLAALGGDDRLAVGGDSAGGNLAAAVALACRDGGPRLAAQLLIYPGVDFEPDAPFPSRVDNADGYFLTVDDMTWFGDHYLPPGADRRDPRAAVLHAPDLGGVAPAVLATAEFDPLRDEGDAYAAALAAAGVPVVHHRYDGLIHGFFGLGVVSPAAAAATLELCRDLRGVLEGSRV